jgi:hypothetical protein
VQQHLTNIREKGKIRWIQQEVDGIPPCILTKFDKTIFEPSVLSTAHVVKDLLSLNALELIEIIFVCFVHIVPIVAHINPVIGILSKLDKFLGRH